MSVWSKSTRSSQEPYPRLRLAVPESGLSVAGLQWLARRFHLDVHGPSGLFRITRIEMGFAALLLSAVFLFDFSLWTYTIQSMMTSALAQLWLRLPAAACGGLLIALVLFIYERQFITVELKGIAWWGFGIRLVVIGIAAVITATSLHLLVFNGPIQRRMWEQNVRFDAMNHIGELRRAVDFMHGRAVERYDIRAIQDQINADNTTLTNETEALNSANQQKVQQQSELAGEKANLRSLLQALRDYQSRLQTSTDANERQQLLDDIAKLQSSRMPHSRVHIAALEGKIAQSDVEIKRLQDDIERIRREMGNLTTTRTGFGAEGRNTTQAWNQRFREIDAGKTPTVGPPLELPPQDYFAKIGVLVDLIFGRPPSWPAASGSREQETEDRQMLERELGIVDRPVSNLQHWIFVWEFAAVFGIGFLIPLLTIAFKFMMPEPLKKYYSSSYQSRLGNPEAIVFERAKEDYL
jgi:Domain of unknown function (DUF4407)